MSVSTLVAVFLICLISWARAADPSTNQAPVADAAATAVPGAHLDHAPGKPPKFWSVATAETIMARWPDYSKAYFNAWTYVNGYVFYGMDMLYRATGDRKYFDYTKRYIDQFVDENGEFRGVINAKGRTNTPSFNNLDSMMTGNTLAMLYEYTKDQRYKKAAQKIRRALESYPRNNDGGFWHAKSLPGQMWSDGIFMGQIFLTRYGKSIGDSQYCWDEAAKQLTVYARRAQRGDSGLYLHALYESGHGEKVARWADPKTGLSPEVWSEGLGWYALVLVETLAGLPSDHAQRADLVDIFHRLAAGLKRCQDPKSGRWFQVVDKGDQPDNWTDTSGSAMFTYAIQRGIELGLLDKTEYALVVSNGYRGITANAKINDRGLVDIYSACDGLVVQTNYERYIHHKKMINAKEAVAGFLWASAIVEKPELEKSSRHGFAPKPDPGQGGAAVEHSFVCADYTQGKVFVIGRSGQVEWEYPAPNCNDLWRLPVGNLLFTTGHGVKEVTPNKQVVFDYQSQSEIYACQRLTNGNTFIGECDAGRLLEVASSGEIVKEVRLLPEGQKGGHAYMRNARRLANGDYLVAHFGQQVVREYDSQGKLVREIAAPGGPHSVVRLPDGNTLISCGDLRSPSAAFAPHSSSSKAEPSVEKARSDAGPKVFEVDPAGRIVWQVQADELPGISLKFMAGLQRLPNGNTIMANWLGHGQFGKAPHLIEVTPDKHVVWTFSDHAPIKTIASLQVLEEAALSAGEFH